ncbi:hypothetical protein [uncultured Pseudoteredinibacter sp.]|uniref:hypothetical protein n=1 Tax=uncultured Pseudoteredinibacter sp. TaxID=1641701 RepID=UPI0026065622|nr:hypothetical protein [uncultured Pseudoteredinibacter sp.]
MPRSAALQATLTHEKASLESASLFRSFGARSLLWHKRYPTLVLTPDLIYRKHLRSREKSESMQFSNKAKFLLMLFVFVIFIVFSGLKLLDWIEVDSCLDAGGRYNYQLSKCDFIAN